MHSRCLSTLPMTASRWVSFKSSLDLLTIGESFHQSFSSSCDLLTARASLRKILALARGVPCRERCVRELLLSSIFIKSREVLGLEMSSRTVVSQIVGKAGNSLHICRWFLLRQKSFSSHCAST